MKIQQANIMNQYAAEQLNQKGNKKNATGFDQEFEKLASNANDTYQLNTNVQTTFSYNAKISMDSAAVAKLMKEGEDILGSVRDLVRGMLERQGITVEQLEKGEVGEIKVDEITQEKARQLIAPGGELSAEKVSDRIVNFAIAAFGGDKSKIDIIRNSIDRGFAEAEHILGQLADVSKQTYDMIQVKLDNWINGNETEENSAQ